MLLILIPAVFIGVLDEVVVNQGDARIIRRYTSYAVAHNWPQYGLTLVGAGLLIHGLYGALRSSQKGA